MRPETIDDCFAKAVSAAPRLSDGGRALILDRARGTARSRKFDGSDDDALRLSIHFQVIRAEVIRDHWDELTDEDRLLFCFPAAPKVGDSVDLPGRGKGKVLWRKLTTRLGLETGFVLADGSLFNWEFWD